MGHHKKNQLTLIPANGKFQFNHGGILRQQRRGRKQRPLSSREPLHLVFKARRYVIKESSFRGRRSYMLCHAIIRKYSVKFFVKIEQVSIQGDHIHLLVRCSRRTHYQSFFRVVAGQIAQSFQKHGLLKSVTDTPNKPATHRKLWMYRPFTRVVRSFRALKILRDYIQLNEQEALGLINYNVRRLAGLNSSEWQMLWGSG